MLYYDGETLIVDGFILRDTYKKAAIAEALYKNGTIPVKKIAEQLDISKTTLYLYLRYRNVRIGEKTSEMAHSTLKVST